LGRTTQPARFYAQEMPCGRHTKTQRDSADQGRQVKKIKGKDDPYQEWETANFEDANALKGDQNEAENQKVAGKTKMPTRTEKINSKD